MSQGSEQTNYIINIAVILIVVIDIFVLFMYPGPITGIIVIFFTGVFVLIMQFREILK